MVRQRCCICRKSWEPEKLGMFKVPKDARMRELWNKSCSMEFKPSSRLCELHFCDSDYTNPPAGIGSRTRLKSTAVPKIEQPDPLQISTDNITKELDTYMTASRSSEDINCDTMDTNSSVHSSAFEEELSTVEKELSTADKELPAAVPMHQKITFGKVQQTTLLPTGLHYYTNKPSAVTPKRARLEDNTMPNAAVSLAKIGDVILPPGLKISIVQKPSAVAPINALPQSTLATNTVLPYTSSTTRKFVDSTTQTNHQTMECSTILENMSMKQKLKKLEAANARLQEEVDGISNLYENLQQIFSEGQMRKLMYPNKKIHWTTADLTVAMDLRAAGPKSYNYLYNKGFPLPSSSTLTKWLMRQKFEDGILQSAITYMQNVGIELTPQQRVCVLTFSEMNLSYPAQNVSLSDNPDKKQEVIQAHVMLAQSLQSDAWQYPVYYSFDGKITKAVLDAVVKKLYAANYNVVAIVTHVGFNSIALWKELQIKIDKTWIENAANKHEKIYVFANPSHLIRLIRNHFVQTGFTIDDKHLSTETIRQLLLLNTSTSAEVGISEDHLNVPHHFRHKVKLAVELLSRNVADAIRQSHSNGNKLTHPFETATFLQYVHEWFELFNSRQSTAYERRTMKPYGTDTDYQCKVLSYINGVMINPIIPKKKVIIPFQKGILLSNVSLALLLEYVREKYGINSLLTSRLSHDPLEELFNTLRGAGGVRDHPSKLQFKCNIRQYLLDINPDIFEDILPDNDTICEIDDSSHRRTDAIINQQEDSTEFMDNFELENSTQCNTNNAPLVNDEAIVNADAVNDDTLICGDMCEGWLDKGVVVTENHVLHVDSSNSCHLVLNNVEHDDVDDNTLFDDIIIEDWHS